MDLSTIKKSIPDVNWYPYSNIAAFVSQLRSLAGPGGFAELTGKGARILDVGTADGDMSFYLESLGCVVDAVDNPATNYNKCRGIEALRNKLGSAVRVSYQDVDFGFKLDGQYDLAIACGILYHLRNPFLFLMTLAMHAERMVLSTRTAHKLPDGTDVAGSAAAYLLDTEECNNDCTNYWIFSPEGLRRCLKRSGWMVEKSMVLGAGENSDPVVNDQRTFVLCRRVPNWRDLPVHQYF